MSFELRRHARNVHSLKFKLKTQNDVQSVMLLSDLHFDNPHCDRDLLAKHLDEAKRRGSPSDTLRWTRFCAMESSADGRASRNLRISNLQPQYLDSIINDFRKHGSSHTTTSSASVGVWQTMRAASSNATTPASFRVCVS